MQTIAASVVVLLGWLFLGLALVGIGRSVRAVVSGRPDRWTLADFWIGLTATIGGLYAAHLFVPVTARVWWVLGPVALYGLLRWTAPRLRRPSREQVLQLTLVAAIAGYLANRALQPLGAYDSYLYGLQSVRWTHTYKAVPGLANLHSRLGYNSASTMFGSFVGSTFPAEYAHHFANSLLVAVLVLQVTLALRSLTDPGRGDTSRAPALLLVLSAPALVTPIASARYFTSLTPDLPALVVTLAAAYYVTRILTSRDESADWLVAACLLVLMPMVRIQLGAVSLVLVLALVAATAARRVQRPQRRLAVGGFAAAAVPVGFFTVHGYVLSGYPAFPLPLLGAPTRWRVPHERAALEMEVIQAWARDSSAPRAEVLGNFSWARRWAALQADDSHLVSAALVAAAAVALLAVGVGLRLLRTRRAGQPRSPRAAAVTAAVTLIGGAVGLGLALDNRHQDSLALIVGVGLCIGAAIVAMTLMACRSAAGPELRALAAVSLAALVFVSAWAVSAPTPRFALGGLWLVATGPATAAVLLLRRELGSAAAVCTVAMICVAGTGFQLYKLGTIGTRPVMADGSGWLGLSEPGEIETRIVVLPDGERVRIPAQRDQCGNEPLPCTPYADGSWTYVDRDRLDRGFVSR